MDPLLGDCSLEVLRQRRSWKWMRFPPDVIPAWLAEMDFDLAEPVKEAVRAVISSSDAGYSRPQPDGFGEAYAAFAAQQWCWAPDPGRVFAVPDVMTGIAEVLYATTPHGSGVVLSPPIYPPFFFRLRLANRKIIEAPMRRHAGGRYQLDPQAIDAALARPDAAAYLLCSPHNPTGRVWSRDDLTMVASLCDRHGAVLLVDEIHAPLALPGVRHIPFLSLGLDPDLARRTFTFTSASKGWNTPGLKCGLAVVERPEAAAVLAERWEALLPSHLGAQATIAAFRDGLPWLDAVRGQLDDNRALTGKLLATHLPSVGYQPPEASFLAWLDCTALGLDDPVAHFLHRAKVAVNRGLDYGEPGRGFVRLNMGTSPDMLQEILRRMGSSIGAL
ncbi:MAG TPA: aminotransferase class I/II-fold pyridoxal phosphate-dependent enzyme [Streptosporangiaceae bacterium]|nr:aminotransferase class I/II-fold pyridoxal phosphate-dependent enzyme [Streptosporangiaceae bacterium]